MNYAEERHVQIFIEISTTKNRKLNFKQSKKVKQ